MVTTKTDEKPADDKTPAKPPAPQKVTQGDSSLPPEQEDRIVDKVVAKLRDIGDDIFGGGGSDSAGGNGKQGEGPKPPATVKDEEADAEAQVRAVLPKIRQEEEHAAAHEKLARELEKPPTQHSWATRLMGWARDGD